MNTCSENTCLVQCKSRHPPMLQWRKSGPMWARRLTCCGFLSSTFSYWISLLRSSVHQGVDEGSVPVIHWICMELNHASDSDCLRSKTLQRGVESRKKFLKIPPSRTIYTRLMAWSSLTRKFLKHWDFLGRSLVDMLTEWCRLYPKLFQTMMTHLAQVDLFTPEYYKVWVEHHLVWGY